MFYNIIVLSLSFYNHYAMCQNFVNGAIMTYQYANWTDFDENRSDNVLFLICSEKTMERLIVPAWYGR
jgi:hypothetical protein